MSSRSLQKAPQCGDAIFVYIIQIPGISLALQGQWKSKNTAPFHSYPPPSSGAGVTNIYLSIFLYVLTPEGDIRWVPGNQVLNAGGLVLIVLLVFDFLCNVSSVSSE